MYITTLIAFVRRLEYRKLCKKVCPRNDSVEKKL